MKTLLCIASSVVVSIFFAALWGSAATMPIMILLDCLGVGLERNKTISTLFGLIMSLWVFVKIHKSMEIFFRVIYKGK